MRLLKHGFLVLSSFSLATAIRGQQQQAVPDSPKPKISSPAPNSPAIPTPSAQAEEANTTVNADGSTTTGNLYVNPFFGFSIEFPRGWQILSNKQAQAGMIKNERKIIEEHPEIASKRPDTGAPLLVVAEATGYKGGNGRRTLKILASDVSGETGKITGLEYLNATVKLAKEGKLPIRFTSAPEATVISGKKLAKAYATMVWEGATYYVATYAFTEKGYVVQFLFTSPEEDGLSDLEPSIQSLKFQSKDNRRQ